MLLYAYLNVDSTEKTHDISTLTKKGIRLMHVKAYSTVQFEGGLALEPGDSYIKFPLLNGRLPNNLTIIKGDCNITILELAGVGDENYWKITKENDNGIPKYGLDRRK